MSHPVPSNFIRPVLQPTAVERHVEVLPPEQQSQVQILAGVVINTLYKPLFDLTELAATVIPISLYGEAMVELALSVKTTYQSYFDPKYIELHTFLRTQDVNESVAKILSLARNGPEDALRNSLYIIECNEFVEILNSLFKSPDLTPADMISIRDASLPWIRKGHAPGRVMNAFFERKDTSIALMDAFCSLFKNGFFYDDISENLPYEAFANLNRIPSLLKVFLGNYFSARREQGLSVWGPDSIAVRYGFTKARDALFKEYTEIDDLKALKSYLECNDEEFSSYFYESWVDNCGVYLEKVTLESLKTFLKNLNIFINKYPQFISLISTFSQQILENALVIEDKVARLDGEFHGRDPFSDKTPVVALFLFSLSHPLPESLLGHNILAKLYASENFRHFSAYLTFEEFNEFMKTFSQVDLKYQNVCRLSQGTMSDLARVATNELSEVERKNPRLLIAKALYQWLQAGANDEEKLVVLHEGNQLELSPSFALALLNGSKNISWYELKAKPLTIECNTLENDTGTVTLSALDQKLLAAYSDFFAALLSQTWNENLPFKDVSVEAVEDLVRYLADPFLSFEDVDQAADILATANFFQAPTLVNRAVNWLNEHFASIKTEEERQDFVDQLLAEDSLVRDLPILHTLGVGYPYQQQIDAHLNPV